MSISVINFIEPTGEKIKTLKSIIIKWEFCGNFKVI